MSSNRQVELGGIIKNVSDFHSNKIAQPHRDSKTVPTENTLYQNFDKY